MSKWRNWKNAAAIAVIRDGLEECGLYPFRVYDYREVEYQRRIKEATVSNIFSAMLKAVYAGKDEDRSFHAMVAPSQTLFNINAGTYEMWRGNLISAPPLTMAAMFPSKRDQRTCPATIEQYAYQSRGFT